MGGPRDPWGTKSQTTQAPEPLVSTKPVPEVKVVPTEEPPEDNQIARTNFRASLKKSKHGVDAMLLGAQAVPLDGKTMGEWEEYFKVDVPKFPTVSDVNKAIYKTGSLIAFSSHRLGRAVLVELTLKREVETRYAKRFTQLKNVKGRKAPSNDAAEFQIKSEIPEIYDQLMLAQYVVGFWERQRAALISMRKVLETIMFGLTSEMKNKIVMPETH